MDHSGSTGMEALATGRHQNSATSTSEVLIWCHSDLPRWEYVQICGRIVYASKKKSLLSSKGG